ncbi:hypothetical protein I4U23_020288 [Adineta vaga]|nr:hypothetical protein I4U23_020288 [Adineta vaga]
MSFSDNKCSPSLSFCQTDSMCTIQYDGISSPSSTSIYISNVSSTTSNTRMHENEQKLLLDSKRKCPTDISMISISRRLLKRKLLYSQLSVVSNMMCFFGISGVFLMIIENEIVFLNRHGNTLYFSWFLKLIISITTILLVCLVFYYHKLDITLYAVNNSIDNWRVGLTSGKVFLILLEAFICIIHPVPIELVLVSNSSYINVNSTTIDSIPPIYTSLNIALGLPMFARLYLIGRFIIFHSHLVRDAVSQSLGSLNEVSVNFLFLIKTYLSLWPTRCLSLFCILLFLIGSWSLRVCSYQSTTDYRTMLDSMWLFIVTFTTVGYGDLTPTTYCGRGVAAITALIGVISTALLISVLAQKLEFSRSEKYVHNFVVNMELTKERKNQSANIIKYSLLIWILKRRNRTHTPRYISAQRNLFRAILLGKQLKQEQKRLIDVCVGLPELITMQRQLSIKIRDNTDTLVTTKLNVEKVEEKLASMEQKMTNIQDTLQLILNRLSQ